MAEEQQIEAPKGKGKLLIIIAVVAVLLIGVAAAAFFMTGSDDDTAGASNSSVSQSAQPVVEPISYVNIPQPFVFNVTGDSRNRMVQIKAQLMVRGRANEELARYHSPLIESSLINTFASSTVEQLRTPNGRVELRDKASDDVKASLSQAVGQPVIERVLFTDFVIQ
ncbi:flagellar basal body-associated protein FliL [Vibrio agarivorans]|uniref:flagellar basal body-associated protein FliL n=1 Tax=Vibrio agarivorans TaxID=153622 RepID=UPI00222F7B6E|nr:flagellar basal body-associated protein FliL [Vibrio agarivorans]MDN3662815.1 flagellar basal body-associated protein FliL [Vibrio agarivorans]